jgi:hypothetical protein
MDLQDLQDLQDPQELPARAVDQGRPALQARRTTIITRIRASSTITTIRALGEHYRN